MDVAELVMAFVSGGVGFVLADGVDRLLATYNPSATGTPPTNKFTSTGAGTLANTLNVAAKPSLVRLGAGVGMVALPAIGSAMVDGPMARSAFEGMTIGAGISLFKTLWNNFLMPMLSPKDTSPASLQKSFIVRLYPAEVSAHINQAANQTAVSSAGSGALSGAPADVGPFALASAGDPQYPTVDQALRQQTGVQDRYPTVQNLWGTGGPGGDYPTATEALNQQAGMGWQPGPPNPPGPGPQAAPGSDPSCGCVGDPTFGFSAFLGDKQEDDTFLP